jgi:hypothetical protein
MINNHFARFQLPGNSLKTKKMCSLFSWQHAISYLLRFALDLDKFSQILGFNRIQMFLISELGQDSVFLSQIKVVKKFKVQQLIPRYNFHLQKNYQITI